MSNNFMSYEDALEVLTPYAEAIKAAGGTVPDGKTITPIDDPEVLLECANVKDTGYTTLSEILADSGVLLAVLTDDNAIDYLVRSTSFASDVSNSQNAIIDIFSYQYAMDTLLADTTWHDALMSSTYLTKTYSYTGAIQSFNVSVSGIYKLEVWGAAGDYLGGSGGYSYGNVALTAGDTIYVGVGSATFNGGGGRHIDGDSRVGNGGGATHIGTENSQLRYTQKAQVFIVAGGGGGGIHTSDSSNYRGGAGGGTSGSGTPRGLITGGGTQTSAGAGGGYGYGGAGTGSNYSCPGGGGGLYGGSRGAENTDGGAGGSGYIGGCISGTASTSNGVWSSTQGKAVITFVEVQ